MLAQLCYRCPAGGDVTQLSLVDRFAVAQAVLRKKQRHAFVASVTSCSLASWRKVATVIRHMVLHIGFHSNTDTSTGRVGTARMRTEHRCNSPTVLCRLPFRVHGSRP